MSAGHVAIRHGLRGPLTSPSSACATGAHAIGDAMRMIKYGDADVMVAGGSEGAVVPVTVAGFARMQALATKVCARLHVCVLACVLARVYARACQETRAR